MLLFFNSACNLRQGDHHLRQKMKFLFLCFFFLLSLSLSLSVCLSLSFSFILLFLSVVVSVCVYLHLFPVSPYHFLSYTSCLTFPLCWVSPLYPYFNVLRCGNRWELCHCTQQLFYDASHLRFSLFLDRLVTVNSKWLDVASNLLPLETCYIIQSVIFNSLYVVACVRCIVFEYKKMDNSQRAWFLTLWPLSQDHAMDY